MEKGRINCWKVNNFPLSFTKKFYKKNSTKIPPERFRNRYINSTLITPEERITHLIVLSPVLPFWCPLDLIRWWQGPTRTVARAASCPRARHDRGTWCWPGRTTCPGRGPTVALVGSFVEAGGLEISLVPHSFLDFGNSTQRLGLGKGRAPF